MYSPLSGITTNQSEGFNTVLKQYQQWKELPIDLLVLGLYRLQIYYYNEVQRGYCGFGEYHLLSQFTYLSRPSDELLLQKVSTPEEIVSTTLPANDDSADTPLHNVLENPVESTEAPMEDTTFMSECTVDVATDSNASQISRARYV